MHPLLKQIKTSSQVSQPNTLPWAQFMAFPGNEIWIQKVLALQEQQGGEILSFSAGKEFKHIQKETSA